MENIENYELYGSHGEVGKISESYRDYRGGFFFFLFFSWCKYFIPCINVYVKHCVHFIIVFLKLGEIHWQK